PPNYNQNLSQGAWSPQFPVRASNCDWVRRPGLTLCRARLPRGRQVRRLPRTPGVASSTQSLRVPQRRRRRDPQGVWVAPSLSQPGPLRPPLASRDRPQRPAAARLPTTANLPAARASPRQPTAAGDWTAAAGRGGAGRGRALRTARGRPDSWSRRDWLPAPPVTGWRRPAPAGAGPRLAPPRPPRGPASLRSPVASAWRTASFSEQVQESSTRPGRLLSRGAGRACRAPSEVSACTDVRGSLGREQPPVRGNLGFGDPQRGRRFATGTRRGGWKSCMNVEAISRVIAVCYHDNQPLQSPARSVARLHQLGCARGEDRGGLWQPREWAAAVCHASFGQGRAAAVNSSADSCHPEWLRNPGPQHEKRTLFGDMVCFLFITPLATISGWLCLRGAVDHLHFSSRLEAVGLIALTVALFTIYLFWTLVSFRYHCRLYNEWRRTNQRVILLIPKSVSVPSNQQSLLGLHSVKRNSKETIV
uniref:RING-type E3 ubiquitin transferase n=1 Tax=Canis lupus familiaris TaxID=9615 RepID=A0A8C0PR91_CANLF